MPSQCFLQTWDTFTLFSIASTSLTSLPCRPRTLHSLLGSELWKALQSLPEADSPAEGVLAWGSGPGYPSLAGFHPRLPGSLLPAVVGPGRVLIPSLYTALTQAELCACPGRTHTMECRLSPESEADVLDCVPSPVWPPQAPFYTSCYHNKFAPKPPSQSHLQKFRNGASKQ